MPQLRPSVPSPVYIQVQTGKERERERERQREREDVCVYVCISNIIYINIYDYINVYAMKIYEVCMNNESQIYIMLGTLPVCHSAKTQPTSNDAQYAKQNNVLPSFLCVRGFKQVSQTNE